MIEIIPAIDLIDGKYVRLAQGDFSRKKIYGENPLEAALKFEDAGLKRLHVVDLDGARRRRISALKILEEICAKTSLMVDFGGGIKTDENIRAVFDAGARMASVGSAAVARPERFFGWLERFGGERILLGAGADKVSINTSAIRNPRILTEAAKNFGSQCVVLAIDAKSVGGVWKVFLNGGRVETELEAFEWARRGAMLLKAEPTGAVCHTGADTCFGENNSSAADGAAEENFLFELEKIILDRMENPSEDSHMARLFKKGRNKIAQKFGEEAVELIIEAKDDAEEFFKGEAADVLYHFLILLAEKKVSLADVLQVLKNRRK